MHFGTYMITQPPAALPPNTRKWITRFADFVHHMTKVALAHTGIWLSDGATNTMPIGPNRGENLRKPNWKKNSDTVHRAWKKGYDHIRHSLWNGFTWGWDLNPCTAPYALYSRFAFFLESYDDAVERLKTFVEKSKSNTDRRCFWWCCNRAGLLNYFLRALNSGLSQKMKYWQRALTLDEIRGRSFKKFRKTGRNNYCPDFGIIVRFQWRRNTLYICTDSIAVSLSN